MRFTSLVDDAKSFEDLLQAVKSANKFLRDAPLTVKLLPDAIYFVCANGLHDGYFMEIKMFEAEIFSLYRMDGVSGDNNMIIMSLDGTDFVRCFEVKDEKVKIRLTRRSKRNIMNVDFHFSGILKCIPLKIHNGVQVVDYMTPRVSVPIVGLNVAPMNVFQNFVSTFSELKINAMDLTLCNDGRLILEAETEDKVQFIFNMDEQFVADNSNDSFQSIRVRLSVPNVHHFLKCIPSAIPNFIIRVSEHDQIVIVAKHSNIEYSFYVSSLRDEESVV